MQCDVTRYIEAMGHTCTYCESSVSVYVYAQQAKRGLTWRSPLPSSTEWGVGDGEEWWEGVDVWNQVFRLRFSGGRTDSAAKAATLNPGSVKINVWWLLFFSRNTSTRINY